MIINVLVLFLFTGEYLENLCHGSVTSCKPCLERLPSCVGLPNGLNAATGQYWKPMYIECYKSRTISVNQCNALFFHPMTRTCTDLLKRGTCTWASIQHFGMRVIQ